jgi:hypothetical protein
MLLKQQYCRGEEIPDYSMNTLLETVEEYRSSLMDISWFIPLTEPKYSTQANQDDNCKGHLGKGRFKSLALLD